MTANKCVTVYKLVLNVHIFQALKPHKKNSKLNQDHKSSWIECQSSTLQKVVFLSVLFGHLYL